VIGLRKNIKLKIGKKSIHDFYQGYYVYAGSALRNLNKRIKRHCRKDGKKKFWHIDYFLNNEYTSIEEAVVFKTGTLSECGIVQKLSSILGAYHPVLGFGASDCRNRCRSHLVYYKNYPDLYDLKKYGGVIFTNET